MKYRLLQGNVEDALQRLDAESVHCVVTSPPYWGLRDYGTATWEGGESGCDHLMLRGTQGEHGERATRTHTQRVPYKDQCGRCGAVRNDQQIGLEPTPGEYVARLVEVFRHVRRVLRADGTLWLNLGDSYATGAGKVGECPGGGAQGENWIERGATTQPNRMPIPGLKPKDLVGIPWRVAFALQADGWYLRSDIIWAKPNPMPESVMDRPTKSHEYLFLLAKSERYYYDVDAIREPCTDGEWFHGGYDKPGVLRQTAQRNGRKVPAGWNTGDGGHDTITGRYRSGNKAKSWGANETPSRDAGLGLVETVRGIPWEDDGKGRNKRDVWTVTTQPYPEAHFATFPEDLIEPCIKAGAPDAGWVLDPFTGSGTVGVVALKQARNFVGAELKPEYVEMTRRRLMNVEPMFHSEVA